MDITERLITNAARDAIGSPRCRFGATTLTLPTVALHTNDRCCKRSDRHRDSPFDARDALADIASKNDVKVAPQWLPGKIIEEIFEAHCESDIEAHLYHRPSRRYFSPISGAS